MHGDGGEILTDDSMMVITFSGLLARVSTRELTFLVSVWPYSVTAKQKHHDHDTWLDAWHVIQWSLNALARGRHPSRDDKRMFAAPA